MSRYDDHAEDRPDDRADGLPDGSGEPEAGGDAGPERVLRPLPPVRGRGFAVSWWGRRWLRALEDTALDSARLTAGRRHARAGAVGAVAVRPGRITAVVRGRDGSGHRADVLLRRLTDAQWRRLLTAVADEAGHLAALLDGELPPRLVEDAAGAGVELLPGIGDLEPSCGCGAWDLCEHAAALCYQMGRLLDEDPFLLMLLRGRGERELLTGLQRSGREGHDGPRRPAAAPVPAAAAYARTVPPLPAPPPPPDHPGTPPDLRTAEPAPGIDPAALEFLVADTARRAARLLAAALAPGHQDAAVEPPLDRGQDAARMAAAGPPAPPLAARLAAGCGRTVPELQAAGLAWRFGGAAGLAVLDAPARDDGPDGAADDGPDDASPGPDWETADGGRPRLRRSGDRWTVVGRGVQLRRGADGRWWPFVRRGRLWFPAGGPQPDPATALAAAEAGAGPASGSPPGAGTGPGRADRRGSAPDR